MTSCESIKWNLLSNHNKTNDTILRIYNICGLKVFLSDFSKASASQINLIWSSRALHRIFALCEQAFLNISVLGLGNLKVIFNFLLKQRIHFHALQVILWQFKPLTLELFAKNAFFWTFWTFWRLSAWVWAQTSSNLLKKALATWRQAFYLH